MFHLDLPTEPRWIDLPFGVRVQVKPLDAPILAAARGAAIRAVREELGVPGEQPDDDPAWRDARIEQELARGLARYGALDWEGVGDAWDRPLPFSQDGMAALLHHPGMPEAFSLAYTTPVARLDAEGNASAPAPNGSTAGAPDTAPDAESGAPSAPPS